MAPTTQQLQERPFDNSRRAFCEWASSPTSLPAPLLSIPRSCHFITSTRWTTRFSFPPNLGGYVTKFARHQALQVLPHHLPLLFPLPTPPPPSPWTAPRWSHASRAIDSCITQLKAQGPSEPLTRVKMKKKKVVVFTLGNVLVEIGQVFPQPL